MLKRLKRNEKGKLVTLANTPVKVQFLCSRVLKATHLANEGRELSLLFSEIEPHAPSEAKYYFFDDKDIHRVGEYFSGTTSGTVKYYKRKSQ